MVGRIGLNERHHSIDGCPLPAFGHPLPRAGEGQGERAAVDEVSNFFHHDK